MGRSPEHPLPLGYARNLCSSVYMYRRYNDDFWCSMPPDRLSGAYFHQPGSENSVSMTDILKIVESYPIYLIFLI
jgi:hypothetical protein